MRGLPARLCGGASTFVHGVADWVTAIAACGALVAAVAAGVFAARVYLIESERIEPWSPTAGAPPYRQGMCLAVR